MVAILEVPYVFPENADTPGLRNPFARHGLERSFSKTFIFGVLMLQPFVLDIACKSNNFSSGNQTPARMVTPAPTPTIPGVIPPPVVYPTIGPVIMPAPPGAITQGNFTVWAVPPNPHPWEDYQINIRVQLPANTQGYTINDLSGNVLGTDGWVQNIRESWTSGIPMPTPAQFQWPIPGANGTTMAMISMMVPGAAAQVQDTISVSSVLLNQSQQIHLTFQ